MPAATSAVILLLKFSGAEMMLLFDALTSVAVTSLPPLSSVSGLLFRSEAIVYAA